MFASDDLPPELPEEELRTLVEAVSEDLRKIGLYMNGVAVNIDTDEDPDNRSHTLMVQCSIGAVAFSNRVQAPEEDQFDTEFKKIELGAQDDHITDILKRYEKGYDLGEDDTD